MLRTIALAALATFVTGCGLLVGPFVQRLPPERQAEVDDSWANMFSPPDRLDRLLLLDTIVTNAFHQSGVDELRLVSKKDVEGALVVMEVDFDRFKPEHDAFTLTYIDPAGLEVRRERYQFSEVEARLRYFASVEVAADDSTPEESKAIQARRRAEREARMQMIDAATQPAAPQ